MEQKIGEAVVVDFDCASCLDTGIKTGTAVLNEIKVIIQKPCELCNTAKNMRDNYLVNGEENANI